MSIIGKLIGNKTEKRKCYMLSDEDDKRVMLPGQIYNWYDTGMAFKYEFLDGKGHMVIGDKISKLFEFEGVPVYGHKIGSLYTTTCSLEQPVASDLFLEILESDATSKGIGHIDEWSRDSGTIPWKKVIIVVGIIIAAIILWVSGIIPQLLEAFGVKL